MVFPFSLGCRPQSPWSTVMRGTRNPHHTQSTLEWSSWALLHKILKNSLEKHLIKVLYVGTSNVEYSGEVDKKPSGNEMWFGVQNEKENNFCKQMMCLPFSVCPRQILHVGAVLPPYIFSPHSFQTLEPRGPTLRTTLQRLSPRMLQAKGLVPVESHKPNSFNRPSFNTYYS